MVSSFGRAGGLVLVMTTALSGCMEGNGEPSPTPEPTACSPYEAPTIEKGGVVFRGQNAFGYMLSLVCDFSTSPSTPRARVPGTANQSEGASYLSYALTDAGFVVSKQEFTGTDYEAVMRRQDTQGSSYQTWFKSCDASSARDQLETMRALHFTNLVATGGTPGGPVLLFMAHWDSKRFTSDGAEPVLGANDGASGVGVLIELARVLDAETLPWEIRILLTDGEDGFEDCHPLAGSTVYADRLDAAQRTAIRGLVLLDMVGDLNATFTKGCGSDAALADQIWSIADRLDVRQFVDQRGCYVVDDHTPFEERGVKGVDIIDYAGGAFPPYWHTAGDTPDKLSPEMLGDVGNVLHTLVKEFATSAAASP